MKIFSRHTWGDEFQTEKIEIRNSIENQKLHLEKFFEIIITDGSTAVKTKSNRGLTKS